MLVQQYIDAKNILSTGKWLAIRFKLMYILLILYSQKLYRKKKNSDFSMFGV